MEPYKYEFADAELEALARVISDLFPEQTLFAQRSNDVGAPELVVQWVAMRFGSTARRMTLTVRFAPAAFARFRALASHTRARSFAVLRAFVEAALGSLEEQYANGDAVPREVTIELGDEFA
jgi:predicted DNA-binding protein